ncbi:MAG: rod shape-determining protein MreC [Clostridia bacterium]|nr:rod shape-determining protein MreC [Clostridia bacterium]
MRKLFGNRIFVLLLTITISVSVVLGVINATKTKSTFMGNVAMVVITPLSDACTWVGRKVSGFFGYFGDIDELREENEKLKSEKKELEAKIRKSEGTDRENKDLRALLELSEAYPSLELVSAEVISRSASNWYESFIIDKGTADGLKIGQGVISGENVLLGRISDLGSTWARVTVLTDSGHSVSAKVIRSGDLGIVEGDLSLSKDGQCRLSFISKNSDIVVGDYLETSGLGGVYPKGIEIGKVIEIKPEVQGISQYAIVETSAEIETISKVMIITNNPAESTAVGEE